MPRSSNKSSTRRFVCDWTSCTKRFNRKDVLKAHYRVHTKERPFACNFADCGRRFTQRSGLKSHVRTHTGEKPYQCQLGGCGKSFSDSSGQISHQRTHTEERLPYDHDGCLKSYGKNETLVIHQRREHRQGMALNHTDNCSPVVENESSTRCFPCTWQSCTKSFNRDQDLQRHFLIHTGQKPHTCPVRTCGKGFTQPSALKSHVRTHTGEKPCLCQHPGCGKSFRNSSNLSRHRLIHGRRRYKKRRYECDHVGCSRWFRKLKTLQDHQQKPHKQGKTPNHTDNCSPDSYDGEPPAIPQHSSMTSSPHELDYIDLCSQDETLNWLLYFADLPVQSQGCHMSQHEDNRQGIPTSVPGDYGISKHGEQTHTQLVLQEEAVSQQTYEVSGTGHPGVAMMTNAVLPQCQLSQEVQRLSIDPQCLASGTATAVPNPWIPDSLYTHEFSFQTEDMSSIPVVSGPQHTQ